METSSPFYFSCYYSLKNFNAKYTLWEVADVSGEILGTVECKHGSPRIFQISSLLRRWHRSSCTAFTGIRICYWSWWCSLVILIWCGKIQWKLKVWNTLHYLKHYGLANCSKTVKASAKSATFQYFQPNFLPPFHSSLSSDLSKIMSPTVRPCPKSHEPAAGLGTQKAFRKRRGRRKSTSRKPATTTEPGRGIPRDNQPAAAVSQRGRAFAAQPHRESFFCCCWIVQRPDGKLHSWLHLGSGQGCAVMHC